MIVLGLLFILIAVAAGLALFVATSPVKDAVTLDFWGVTQVKVLPIGLLIAGAVLLLLFWLGWSLLRMAVKRQARRRREAKDAERETLAERERLTAQQLHERQQQDRVLQERQRAPDADAVRRDGSAGDGRAGDGRVTDDPVAGGPAPASADAQESHPSKRGLGGLFGGRDKGGAGTPEGREGFADGREGRPGDRGRL